MLMPGKQDSEVTQFDTWGGDFSDSISYSVETELLDAQLPEVQQRPAAFGPVIQTDLFVLAANRDNDMRYHLSTMKPADFFTAIEISRVMLDKEKTAEISLLEQESEEPDGS